MKTVEVCVWEGAGRVNGVLVRGPGSRLLLMETFPLPQAPCPALHLKPPQQLQAEQAPLCLVPSQMGTGAGEAETLPWGCRARLSTCVLYGPVRLGPRTP